MADDDLQECIQACLDCYRSCQHSAARDCLERGGAHVEAEHMRLMMACAEMCRATAHVMMSGVPQSGAVGAACAQLCRACADSCAQVGQMEECVQACGRCAEACEQMANEESAFTGRHRSPPANQGQLAM